MRAPAGEQPPRAGPGVAPYYRRPPFGCVAQADGPLGPQRAPRGARSGGPHFGLSVALLIVVLAAAVAGAWVVVQFSPPARTVAAPASQVLLNVSDMPKVGWGAWASGTNGSGAWRLFAVHNELILATLNVTLWVDRDADAARRAMDGIGQNLSYLTQDGGVPGSDGSRFGTFDFGVYAGMVVCRYNVVFLLQAHLESSFSLTRSDLGEWAGWQLTKIESMAM